MRFVNDLTSYQLSAFSYQPNELIVSLRFAATARICEPRRNLPGRDPDELVHSGAIALDDAAGADDRADDDSAGFDDAALEHDRVMNVGAGIDVGALLDDGEGREPIL